MRINRKQDRQQDSEIGKNPIELIDEVGRRIQDKTVGYQAGLRNGLVKLYGAIVEIQQNFESYSDLVQAPCLAKRKRIREAIEENFDQYIHEAVVRRAFAGSDVSASCISKFICVMRYCTEQKVSPAKASAQIEEWGGLEATYQRGKRPAKKDTSSLAKGGSKSKAKTSASEPTVTAQTNILGDDYLRITLQKKAFRSLYKAKEGEERLLHIRCKGCNEEKYLIWELVEDGGEYNREISDNDNSYGDIEDAA